MFQIYIQILLYNIFKSTKERKIKMKIAIFIDCQNDFLKGGKLAYGYPEKDNFENVLAFAKYCVENELICYRTQDTHDETKYDFKKEPISGYLTTLEGKKLPIEHCVKHTKGWKIDSKLLEIIERPSTSIEKRTFGSNDLVAQISNDIHHLKNNDIHHLKNIDEILICGYCTSICVLANAVLLRAKFPNMKITVLEDCCGDVSKEAHDAALTVLKMQQIDICKFINK